MVADFVGMLSRPHQGLLGALHLCQDVRVGAVGNQSGEPSVFYFWFSRAMIWFVGFIVDVDRSMNLGFGYGAPDHAKH